MRLSEEGRKLVERFEGFRPRMYLDSASVPTIGIGHAIQAGENFTEITEQQAQEILSVDVLRAERAVMRLIQRALSQSQFDALVDFVFNLGAGRLQASTLRKRINRGENGVREQFMRWTYAGGVKKKQLVQRRAAEAALFERKALC